MGGKQCRPWMQHQIWLYNVCSRLFVQILWVNMVLYYSQVEVSVWQCGLRFRPQITKTWCNGQFLPPSNSSPRGKKWPGWFLPWLPHPILSSGKEMDHLVSSLASPIQFFPGEKNSSPVWRIEPGKKLTITPITLGFNHRIPPMTVWHFTTQSISLLPFCRLDMT